MHAFQSRYLKFKEPQCENKAFIEKIMLLITVSGVAGGGASGGASGGTRGGAGGGASGGASDSASGDASGIISTPLLVCVYPCINNQGC